MNASTLIVPISPAFLARTATSPFSMAMTGLMDRRVPAKAEAEEIRPPFFKYSKVSKSAIDHTFFKEHGYEATMAQDCTYYVPGLGGISLSSYEDEEVPSDNWDNVNYSEKSTLKTFKF